MKLADYGLDPIVADELPEAEEFKPIPEGTYTVRIVGFDLNRTKDGTGVYFKATLAIAEGPYANRQIYKNINYINKSEQAEIIGKQELNVIFNAAGITGSAKMHDTDEVLNAIIRAKVVIKEQEGYRPTNDVKSIMLAKDTPSAPRLASPMAKSAPTNAPTTKSVARPWGQR